jgi:Lipase (class 3)
LGQIYLVYHTFSLAELFSMSGFVLVQSTISTSLAVAEESVRLVDIMFGSNETSRALASIVMLVAKELSDEEDKSWTRWLTGGTNAAVLGRLTKTATLFACLQHHTFDRIKGDLMGELMWDVTVSSLEKEHVMTSEVVETHEQKDGQLIKSSSRISTEMECPTTSPLDTIDVDDAVTVVDAEEYETLTSALPAASLPQSASTAFYEVTTETTVTNTTTVQFINSTSHDRSRVETRALRRRQINTTTDTSKYKIAVQKVTDKLKVKKLQKTNSPKITEIEEKNLGAVKKVLNRARRGFSPSGAPSNGASSKQKEPSKDVSDLQVSPGSMAPPIRSRDTKANILRTQAQRAKSPDPQTKQLVRQPQTQTMTAPRPPPRSTPLYRTAEADRAASPTKHQRRNSTVSICSVISLRSDSHLHSCLLETPSPMSFPLPHLVSNLSRFMRFSSASYGWNFMRLLGIGSLSSTGVDSLHHANHHAFAQHTNLPLSSILLSSFSIATFGAQTPQLVHFVSVDHESGCVVLTCRGTLGVADILTDLACDYESIRVYGESYSVHKGMLAAAKQLSVESSRVCKVIKEALESNPGYGLVLCGHSLVFSLFRTWLIGRAVVSLRYWRFYGLVRQKIMSR